MPLFSANPIIVIAWLTVYFEKICLVRAVSATDVLPILKCCSFNLKVNFLNASHMEVSEIIEKYLNYIKNRPFLDCAVNVILFI